MHIYFIYLFFLDVHDPEFDMAFATDLPSNLGRSLRT